MGVIMLMVMVMVSSVVDGSGCIKFVVLNNGSSYDACSDDDDCSDGIIDNDGIIDDDDNNLY